MKGRAKQLIAAGYKSVEDIAKADHRELCENVTSLFPTQAINMILSAKVCCSVCVYAYVSITYAPVYMVCINGCAGSIT